MNRLTLIFINDVQYAVTATQHALTALELLRENKDNYDIVISDVQMPDMDGFKLLEIIGLEMDLPVISKWTHYVIISFFLSFVNLIPYLF